MRKIMLGLFFTFFGLAFVTSAFAKSGGHGIMISGNGIPLYVVIEVNWDGDGQGDWTVWGPKWTPEVGTGEVLSSCTECLEMNYNFVFKGKTVQFEEVYVPGVEATPQVRHVVLHDTDGDGIYTGSLPAQRYEYQPGYLYHDRIDYEVSFDEGQLTNFRYLEYEHKKLLE